MSAGWPCPRLRDRSGPENLETERGRRSRRRAVPRSVGRGRSICRSAAMRPGRGVMTTTRSDRNTASGIEWVTNSDGLARLAGESRSPQMRSSSSVHARRASWRRARRTARPSAAAADRAAARGRARRAAACRPTARAAACRRSRRGRPCRSSCARALRGSRRRSRPASSAGSSTLSRIERHFSRTGAWKTMPTSANGPRHGAAGDRRRVPAVAGRSPATMRSSVDLPQPLGPTSGDELAARRPPSEMSGERLDRAARRLVGHADRRSMARSRALGRREAISASTSAARPWSGTRWCRRPCTRPCLGRPM